MQRRGRNPNHAPRTALGVTLDSWKIIGPKDIVPTVDILLAKAAFATIDEASDSIYSPRIILLI